MPEPSKILGIQYLRGAAALLVVYHHAFLQFTSLGGGGPSPDRDLTFGAAGVDIFFVMSGVIMWATTCGRPTTPVEFWRRRLIRIVPLYWIFTIGLVAICVARPRAFPTAPVDASSFIGSLLFVPHYHSYYVDSVWPILPPGWTLNYEMFFYAVFGMTLIAGRRLRPWLLCTLLGAMVACGLILPVRGAVLITYTDPILLEFCGGVVIGVLMTSGRLPQFWLCVGIALAGCAGFALWLAAAIPCRVVAWGLPAMLLVAGVVGMESRRPILILGIPMILGDASYSIYLSHVFALGGLHWFWTRLGVATSMRPAYIPVAIIAAAVAGIILHRYLERPLNRLSRQRLWLASPPGMIGRLRRAESD